MPLDQCMWGSFNQFMNLGKQQQQEEQEREEEEETIGGKNWLGNHLS